MSSASAITDDLCTKCGAPGPFYVERRRGGHHPWCKACRCADATARRQSAPQRQKDYLVAYRAEKRPAILAQKRQASTGWTAEAFENAWTAQGGRCAVCNVEMRRGGQRSNSVCADHDHVTGEPRALLCRRCNVGLGVYERHGSRFENYLARFGGQ